MTSTKMSTIIGSLVGGYAVGLVIHRVWESLGWALPGVPWFAIAGMILLSIILLVAGWPIRRWVSGDRSHDIDHVRAARVLVVAQAAAVVGSLLLGWYLSAATYLLSVGSRTESGLLMFVPAACAAVMAAVGLLVEWFCKLPPDDGEDATRHEPSD